MNKTLSILLVTLCTSMSFAIEKEMPYINSKNPDFDSVTVTDIIAANGVFSSSIVVAGLVDIGGISRMNGLLVKTSTDSTSVGQVLGICPSSITWITPPAGGGGGATVYEDVSWMATDFYPSGYSSSATPVGIEIQVNSPFRALSSSMTLFGLEFLNAPNPNEAIAEASVPASWAASATDFDCIAFTTGVVIGSFWINIAVSTNPVTGPYTIGYSTITVADVPAWEDIPFTITLADNAQVVAGQQLYMKMERAHGDKVGSNVYIKSVRATKN